MAISRYKYVSKIANDLEEFEDLLEARKKKFIIQHKTRIIKGVQPDTAASVWNHFHLWKQSDRYWKLANKYYKDSRYWWVIAEYNQKPTEALLNSGDIIVIPQPLQAALSALGY